MSNKEHWLLGVDGGGTSCRVRLCNAQGKILGEAITGSANVRLGPKVVFDSILSATEAALLQANLDKNILKHTYVGLGLAGAVSDVLNQSIIDATHPFAQLDIDNDAVTACLGAHNGQDGAILILGTGSCGMLNINNQFQVLGGWGLNISDHASGARLGLSFVRRALEAHEGLNTNSLLTDSFLQRFNNNPAQLLNWSDNAKPKDYGSLVPLIIEHYKVNDHVAIELVNRSLQEACLLLDRLISMGAKKICLMGGYSIFIKDLLPNRLTGYLADARGSALDGAIIMAKNLANRT
jgi:glucosamine kinase